MIVVATVEGRVIRQWDDGCVTWFGYGRIDDDGTGSGHGDPDHQADTSLHLNGQPLNADIDQYIVVPPQIIVGVKGVVLGCQAHVTYRFLQAVAVVGDIGPHAKLGEMSIALANALGIDSNPNTGGVDEAPAVYYHIHPGQAAIVNGKQYNLQPYHSQARNPYMLKYARSVRYHHS
jgi:hypothetical protein